MKKIALALTIFVVASGFRYAAAATIESDSIRPAECSGLNEIYSKEDILRNLDFRFNIGEASLNADIEAGKHNSKLLEKMINTQPTPEFVEYIAKLNIAGRAALSENINTTWRNEYLRRTEVLQTESKEATRINNKLDTETFLNKIESDLEATFRHVLRTLMPDNDKRLYNISILITTPGFVNYCTIVSEKYKAMSGSAGAPFICQSININTGQITIDSVERAKKRWIRFYDSLKKQIPIDEKTIEVIESQKILAEKLLDRCM